MKQPTTIGMSVIELLVVISTITIVLAIGFPKIGDFAIRARVSEGLMVADAAKQAMREACDANPGRKIRNADDAGFDFKPTKYVAEAVLSADCSSDILWIGVLTRNTGAYPDPYLAFIGSSSPNKQQFHWNCQLLIGSTSHAPSGCDSISVLGDRVAVVH